MIWKSCILPKHKFILWLLAHEKPLIRDRHSYVTIRHVCFEKLLIKPRIICSFNAMCRLIYEILCVISWICIRHVCSITVVVRDFRGVHRGGSILAKLRVTTLLTCLYHVWNMTNRALFEDDVTNIAGIITMKIKILTLRCNFCNNVFV